MPAGPRCPGGRTYGEEEHARELGFFEQHALTASSDAEQFLFVLTRLAKTSVRPLELQTVLLLSQFRYASHSGPHTLPLSGSSCR